MVNWRSAAPVFAALGDETRLLILGRLSAGKPLSISKLTEGTSITRQAVSKHLRVLGDAGLVRDLRRGRERRFAVESRSLDEARRALEGITRQWDATLERLRVFVED